MTIDQSGNLVSASTSQQGYDTTVTRDVAGGATGWSDAENIDALLESANGQDVAPTDLGDPFIDFSSNTVEPEGAGDYVVGYRLQQVAVDFTIQCDRDLTGQGVITTSGGGLGTTLVGCDGPPVGDTDREYALSLQEQCPE
ncbi:hypothetical protein [Marisediminicola senii]|uniref:hypothetical protein n=1 Tax=Marisediminicola senii TaxID=2711233 RepID=UPI0013EC542C|nr:hypothetical protein [Marisediminicola senii]